MNIIQQPLLHAVVTDTHPVATGICFTLVAISLTSLILHAVLRPWIRCCLVQLTYGDYWLRRARRKSAVTRMFAQLHSA